MTVTQAQLSCGGKEFSAFEELKEVTLAGMQGLRVCVADK